MYTNIVVQHCVKLYRRCGARARLSVALPVLTDLLAARSDRDTASHALQTAIDAFRSAGRRGGARTEENRESSTSGEQLLTTGGLLTVNDHISIEALRARQQIVLVTKDL